jgi:DNA-binding SARP family transcriptional activator/class 3 adenylate cyclase
MEFALLGPLEAEHDGALVDLGGGKQRALLAVLLLNAGRTVSREMLIDDLWGERVPESGPKMVQVFVSRLRKVLPAGVLQTRGTGYAVSVAPDAVDLLRFEGLVADGRAALLRGDAAAAAELFRGALALWRGTPLGEFEEPFARVERPRLEELQVAALEDRIEAELQLGRHQPLAGELEALVARHPLRERLRAQQMRALARSGRQAEALRAYQDARRALLDELGIQPSPMLRELETRILRQEETAAPRVTAPAEAAVAALAPPQRPLPPQPAMEGPPATRYVSNGPINIAYQLVGDGPLDILLTTGWVLPMELFWEDPDFTRFIGRLARFGRVVLSDKRGTGLSDRVPAGTLPTLDERVEDLVAVMDAVGSERPAVFGISEGAPMSALLAASHPQRVSSLALYGGWARTLANEEYPSGMHDDEYTAFVEWVTGAWENAGDLLKLWAPSVQHEQRRRTWWSRALRFGASPGSALAWLHMLKEVDVRAVLPAISAPTLVVHRAGDRVVPVANAHYLAEHIEGARLLVVPGEDHLWWVGDQDAVLDPVEEFFTGATASPQIDRMLLTVLFTDIVDSTRHVSALGDRRWRDLRSAHHDLVRAQLARFGGREINTMGDGFLATFEGPSRAIRCAEAIRAGVHGLGLSVRAGLHVGECELDGDDIAGIALSIGARIAALAGPDEILVSSTVRDLVVGSGIAFEDRGKHALKGVDGAWDVLAVERP